MSAIDLRSELQQDLDSIRQDFSAVWVLRRTLETLLAFGIAIRTAVHFFAYLLLVEDAHHEDLEWHDDLRIGPGVRDRTRPIPARIDALLRLSAWAYVTIPLIAMLRRSHPETGPLLLVGLLAANVAIPLLDPLVGLMHNVRLELRHRDRSNSGVSSHDFVQGVVDTVLAPGIVYRTTAHVLIYGAKTDEMDLTDDKVNYHLGSRPIAADLPLGAQFTMSIWTFFAAFALWLILSPMIDVGRTPVIVALYAAANWIVLLADPLWFGVGVIKDRR